MKPSQRLRPSHVESLTPRESAKRWDSYNLGPLREGRLLDSLVSRWRFETPLYREIEAIVPSGGRILEVGTGIGANALLLTSLGYRVTGVDYREPVLEAARRTAGGFGADIEYEVADAFDLSAFRDYDLVFSAGVVEHWQRSETVLALTEQTLTARQVLCVIPTAKTHYAAEVTDERFYTCRELRSLMREAGLGQVRSFAYGDVPNAAGRAGRALLPDVVHRRIVQRRLGFLAMAYAAVGLSQPARG
jgi:SAM-dependent methyltransferase